MYWARTDNGFVNLEHVTRIRLDAEDRVTLIMFDGGEERASGKLGDAVERAIARMLAEDRPPKDALVSAYRSHA